jgi:uncharacterized membrane protein YedE/YeeE
MSSTASDTSAPGVAAHATPRPALAPWIVLCLAAWLAITWLVGLRQGALFLIGIGFGAALAAVAFGFTTGWRVWLKSRDPTGVLAQLLAIAVAMVFTVPLLASHPELVGAAGPLSVSLLVGAFAFGATMQIADGCGSGTLYKAGLGNAFSLAVLPGFIAGSFLGAAHLDAWLALGSLPPVLLQDHWGAWPTVAAQLAVLGLLAALFWRFRRTAGTRWQGRGIFIAALVLAAFAVLNLLVAGQPWGIVYGLGLWGAKVASALGWDGSGNAFWGRAAQQAQIHASLLTDTTSITNLGLLLGAFIAAQRVGTACPQVSATPRQWVAALLAGLVLGYTSRLAFGCNIGAFFSGIASGSLHGWVWFALAFAGSVVGVRLRAWLGLSA